METKEKGILKNLSTKYAAVLKNIEYVVNKSLVDKDRLVEWFYFNYKNKEYCMSCSYTDRLPNLETYVLSFINGNGNQVYLYTGKDKNRALKALEDVLKK